MGFAAAFCGAVSSGEVRAPRGVERSSRGADCRVFWRQASAGAFPWHGAPPSCAAPARGRDRSGGALVSLSGTGRAQPAGGSRGAPRGSSSWRVLAEPRSCVVVQVGRGNGFRRASFDRSVAVRLPLLFWAAFECLSRRSRQGASHARPARACAVGFSAPVSRGTLVVMRAAPVRRLRGTRPELRELRSTSFRPGLHALPLGGGLVRPDL